MEAIHFPIVKNISSLLLADQIDGMTAEECREAMRKIFADFEKMTGFKPVIKTTNTLPINILLPDENKN